MVVVDYFTKWAEAEPLAQIIKQKTIKFLWKSIICIFKILYAIVRDNGNNLTIHA